MVAGCKAEVSLVTAAALGAGGSIPSWHRVPGRDGVGAATGVAGDGCVGRDHRSAPFACLRWCGCANWTYAERTPRGLLGAVSARCSAQSGLRWSMWALGRRHRLPGW